MGIGIAGRKRPMQRDALHQAIGAAKKDAGRDARLVQIAVTHRGKGQRQTATLTWRLDRTKLRAAWRREGRYLLRTNLTDTDPAKLWAFYLQLTEVEQAFKELKGDLSIRPIHHQLDHRIEAHIFVSFLTYALQVTLKARLRPSATGGRRLPHVYSQAEQRLCLYVPGCGLWRPDRAVSQTILPWTCYWLRLFELWLVTDTWHERGIHPEPPSRRKHPPGAILF